MELYPASTRGKTFHKGNIKKEFYPTAGRRNTWSEWFAAHPVAHGLPVMANEFTQRVPLGPLERVEMTATVYEIEFSISPPIPKRIIGGWINV